MGLLDAKSKTKNTFMITEYNLQWFDYDNITNKNDKPKSHLESFYNALELHKSGVEYNEIYPVSLLIDADFEKIFTRGNYDIRRILSKMNVLNENDRLDFIKAGIKEKHVYFTIDDMDISARTINDLKRNGIHYIWEIVEGGYAMLSNLDIDDRSIDDITDALASYGYKLTDYGIKKPKVSEEEKKIKRKITSLKKDQKEYTKKIEELTAKLKEAEKKLKEVEIKLDEEEDKLAEIMEENN